MQHHVLRRMRTNVDRSYCFLPSADPFAYRNRRAGNPPAARVGDIRRPQNSRKFGCHSLTLLRPDAPEALTLHPCLLVCPSGGASACPFRIGGASACPTTSGASANCHQRSSLPGRASADLVAQAPTLLPTQSYAPQSLQVNVGAPHAGWSAT